jgi:putative endonuclease
VHRYFVYMLRCVDGTFYVGVTNNVERRFIEHSEGANETCYTFSRRPLLLAYVGDFEWIHDAIDFEKKLKTWSHKKKRAFAENNWQDLKRFSFGTDRLDNTIVAAPRLRSG